MQLVIDALAEWMCFAAATAASTHQNLLGHLAPLERVARWREGGRLPILFCHGYMGDATNFVVLRRRMALSGFRSQATVWLWPFWRSIREYAAVIEARAREVLARTGAPALDLVAHSMGGLAARRCMADLGARSPVRRLVTLGSPHRGTLVAAMGPGASAADLHPESALLRSLDGDLERLPPGTVLSILGTLDAVVPPLSSRVPAPQRSLEVEGLGHIGLLVSRRVARAVIEALPVPAPARPSVETARARPAPIAPALV